MNDHSTNLENEVELSVDILIFFDMMFKNSKLFAHFLLDNSGKILKVSEGVFKNFGYEPQDLVGKYFSVLFTETDRAVGKPDTELENVIKYGSSSDLNFIVHKNNTFVLSDGETISVKIKYGERYFIKTVQSVDKQKFLEDFMIATEKKQNLLSEVFDSFPSGVGLFKSVRDSANEIIDFEFVLVNKTAETAICKSRFELTGTRMLDLYPELKNIGILDLQKRVVETGIPENAEFFNDKEGVNKWFKAGYVKFGDGFILTFDDITALKTTNAELEKTTLFLLDTQELSHVCNFEWDIINDQITGTPELYQIFKFEKHTASLNDFINRVCDQDRERVQAAFQQSVQFRKPYDIEYNVALSDGTFRSVYEKARIVFDDHNHPVKMIGTVADITKIKDVEGNLREVEDKLNKVCSEKDEIASERITELLTANKQLMKIIEELDKYAHIVSHDLRSPLNSMESLIFLLGEDYKNKSLNDKEGGEMLELINIKIQNMKDLITQVLASAKEDKKIKEPINMNELVDEVLQTINPPDHYHTLVAPDLPKVKYHKTSLIQIFQNLLGNAIKFMNKEQPLILINSFEHEKEFEIRVCDNGSGIPKGKLDKIFNMYEVGHENENIESFGLGLSIVKKLVELNGGRIWVDSKVGEETNFYFTIPKI